MSWVAVAVAGGAVVGAVVSSQATGDAADTAANAQVEAAQTGEAGINARFQQLQTLFKPFVETGTQSLFAQKNLIGLGGPDAQASAVSQLQQSPQFQAMLKQGETSILQNASATGGLRGGNTQAALAQFSPLLLAQMIDQQYNRLGGLTSLGQNSAAGVGNAGIQVGNTVAGLQQQVGAAQAGAALAGGRAQAGLYSSLGNAMGVYGGMGGFNSFGGNSGVGNPSSSGFVGPTYDPTAYGNSFGAYS